MGRKSNLKGEAWQYRVQQYRDKTGRLRRHRKIVYDLCSCGRKKRTQAAHCRVCYHRMQQFPMEEFMHAARALVQAYEDGSEVPAAELERFKQLVREDWELENAEE